jgi:Kdo2-lipid IVA lauroyltransferase/acyltransferase
MINKVYNGIIKHYFEKLIMAYYDLPKFLTYLKSRITIKGKKILDEGIKKGNGIILITAHFGAVEFLPGILASLKYPVNITVKFNTQKLKKVLENRAKKVNINIIDCSVRHNIPLIASKCLKKNEIFITECDEVKSWIKDKKRTTQLFNKTVYLNKMIDVIARRTNAVVLAAFVRRTTEDHFIVEISNVKKLNSYQTEFQESLENKMLKLFQIYVKKYPDQWYEWKNWQLMKVQN